MSWFELFGDGVSGGVGDGAGGRVWVGIGVEARTSVVVSVAICGLEMLKKARRIIAVKIITTAAFCILQPLNIISYKRLIALPKEQSVPLEEQYLILDLEIKY